MKSERILILVGSICLVLLLVLLPFTMSYAKSGSKKSMLRISSYSKAGSSYALSVGFAAIWKKHLGINYSIQPLGGTTIFAPLIHRGEIDIGNDSGYNLAQAYYGRGAFAPDKKGKVNLLLLWGGHYHRYVVWVRADSGIKTLSDLSGKTIYGYTVGGEVTELRCDATLEAAGLTKKDVHILPMPKIKEGIAALIEKKVGAVFYTFSCNTWMQLDRAVGARIIGIPPEKAHLFIAKTPMFFSGVIPAGDCGVIKEDIPSINWKAFWAISGELSEDYVYNLVKVFWEHQDEFFPVHPYAKKWSINHAVDAATMPFHNGAIKYYKEVGVWTDKAEKLQRRFLAEKRN
ncbi:TAXI family TRAP transporter solute-binding subunit [Thermodesulfobacteriota bacterium]